MKNSRLKKTGIVLLVLIVIFLCVGLVWRGIARRVKEARAALQQITAQVKRGDLAVKVSGTGIVTPAVEEEIRTRISGTIMEFNFKEGQVVQQGQVLARLEVEDLGTRIEQAKLNLTLAERELAKLRQEKTAAVVTAPADGRVAWKIKAGEQIAKGIVIATIQDYNKLRISGKFNAAQVREIQVGQEAQVFLPDFLTSLPARVLEVKTEPEPSGDGGMLYGVTAELENPGALAAGMKGRLTVVTPAGEILSVADSSLFLPEVVEVRAPVAGTVARLEKVDGKEVKAGTVLAEINNPEQAEVLAEQIATAELKLKQAALELEELERQQAKRAENSVILAPISGTVVLPAVSPGIGDMVSPGTVLGRVIDYSQLQAVISVDELDVAKVKSGQKVTLTADALPEIEITGTVAHVAVQGTSQSGVATFDVTIAIDPVAGLKVGMTVNADIHIEKRQNVLLVPIEAVRREGGRNLVQVAEPGGEDGRIVPKTVEVKTGAHDTVFIEILEGLTEGQEIFVLPVEMGGMGWPGAEREVRFGPPRRGGF